MRKQEPHASDQADRKACRGGQEADAGIQGEKAAMTEPARLTGG